MHGSRHGTAGFTTSLNMASRNVFIVFNDSQPFDVKRDLVNRRA